MHVQHPTFIPLIALIKAGDLSPTKPHLDHFLTPHPSPVPCTKPAFSGSEAQLSSCAVSKSPVRACDPREQSMSKEPEVELQHPSKGDMGAPGLLMAQRRQFHGTSSPSYPKGLSLVDLTSCHNFCTHTNSILSIAIWRAPRPTESLTFLGLDRDWSRC